MTNIVYDFILNKVRKKDNGWWDSWNTTWGNIEWDINEQTDLIELTNKNQLWFNYNDINFKLNDKLWLITNINNNNLIMNLYTNWNYIFFVDLTDNKMYRSDMDWSNIIKISDGIWTQLNSDLNYLYYRNLSWSLHKMDFDWNNDIELIANCYDYILHNDKIFYNNWNDLWYLYSINKDWTWNEKIIEEQLSYLKTDWNFLFHISMLDWCLYRINFDWTGNIKITDGPIGTNFIPYYPFVYYAKESSNLYRHNLYIEEEIYNWFFSNFTIDNNNIYLSNNNLFKINKDWTNPVTLLKNYATDMYSIWDYIYYYNNGIKKVTKENNIFTLNDDLYQSDIIENDSNLIYIKLTQSLPFDTDYVFSLSNDFSDNIILPEWDINTDVILWGIIMNPNYNFNDLLSIWDEIILYKQWLKDLTVIVTNIMWSKLMVNDFNIGDVYDQCWIKTEINNYEIIPNNLLNGKHKINLENIFWLTTNKLKYKIKLVSNIDNTKTPKIWTVEILK